jgi:LacI family gluconate utilization system Gnt-I transcriptional repressor
VASGIPVVETWDLTDNPVDMLIGFSHEAVGRSVADYLFGRGRRRLALIGADDTRSARRWKAFADRAAALGLRPPAVQLAPAPAKLGDGRLALRAVLQATPDIDAVFCSSDLVADGVLTEARTQGIDVPGQLAVVGFGDLNFAADLAPALTTVRIDGPRIGELAARMIVSGALGEDVPERLVDVGFSIIERQST